jgi:hypothetical protein
MSDLIFLFTAIYATSLVITGLLLTMREFSRLNRPERPRVSKSVHADRSRRDTTFGYAPGYSGA